MQITGTITLFFSSSGVTAFWILLIVIIQSCPLFNLKTNSDIFMTFYKNVEHHEGTRRIKEP